MQRGTDIAADPPKRSDGDSDPRANGGEKLDRQGGLTGRTAVPPGSKPSRRERLGRAVPKPGVAARDDRGRAGLG
jgi:hypothetical protein